MFRKYKNLIYNAFIVSIFLVFLITPTIRLLFRITPEGINEILNSNQFFEAVKNSIISTFIATIISLVLAFITAFAIERSNVRFKALFSFIFIIPMLIPSISHSFGLVALFGSNGLFTKIFNINILIYGMKGIVIGSVMYSFPVAFIMFQNILQYEDGSPYVVSEVLGIKKINQFLDITMPYMKKTIVLVFFSIFTMIITDYGVPLMIGAKVITLPVLMYNKVVAMVDYNSGSVISLFLLIPAFIAFVVDLLVDENKTKKYIVQNVEVKENQLRDILSYIICILILICALLPIIAFLIMIFETKYPIDSTFTLKHIIKTIDRGALKYLSNSIIIALLVGVIGTVFSFICAYLTSRIDMKVNKIIHMCSIISMSIPGIIIGFSYIMSFKTSILYGTIIIIVIVNIFHFSSSPYLMMYNSLNKLNVNLELVGRILGVNRFFIIKDVIIPKVKNTLVEMFTYFFVNSMMTISAVAFLSPPSPKPLSLMINQFEAQLLMESAAFVSLLILIINVIVKLMSKMILISKKIVD